MVLLVITMIFASIFVTFGCLEDDENSKPEDTLIEFFKTVDTQDGEEAMDLFASKFVDNETVKNKREEMMDDISNGNFTIESFEIKNVNMKEDMNESEKEDMDDFASYCENRTDKDIHSYSRIKVNITQSFSQDSENFTSEIEMPLVKITSDWYLTNILYADYLYQNIPAGNP